ncbi:right-handed parallel beta-helix repeat-containing protein [Methanobacterium sp.]|uniref:right-handed parallel beta-helix repeat-containing protein n=1 Tax=Methanobacterium sp. TaxID=2164 RepID=UPI00257D527D|nr:right-handed parallel beta-helix repeat-containing protein [Methanobacterium sp.]
MSTKIPKEYIKSLVLISIVFLSASNVSAAQWEVGSDQLYTTIQSAIDNSHTLDGDIINVHSGTYTEDVIVHKKLSIQANTGDRVEINSTNTAFTVVNDSTGDGSGSTIDGFTINNSPQGTGVNVSADNCTVKNNEIKGGKTGIAVSGGSTTIANNIISGQSETGILGNLSHGFFTVTGNYISNLMGEGSINGITVSTNGSLTDFNLNGNTLSHISAPNGAVFGFQLGKSKGADGNPEVANVTHLIVTGNIINDINASSAIMGMELVSNSVNALILNNNISHLQGSTNSSVYAVEAAIVGNGTVMVSKNIISHIVAQQQAAGIVTVALGDLLLENNQVINISKANASVAILGLGLLNNATLKNNSVSNITSPQVAAGILGVALSNLNMEYNTANGVDGANDVSMVAAGFNTSKVTGNNLEGDGSGIGLVICSFNGTVNYNRIANYDYYIQNFLFSNFGPSIDEMLKPLDEAIKNHPELEPILKPIRDDLDKMFHQLENSNTTATYNWYGTNAPDPSKFFSGNGTLNYYPWLVLNVNANPSTINPGESSTITADVFHDVAGGDHSKDASLFFSGSRVIFTTNLGNVGSKSVTVPWTNGLARAILRADEGAGIATVTAADYQVVQTLINIQGASNSANAVSTTRTVGMKNTGQPLAGIVMSILLVLGGMISVRKNQ